MKWIFGALAIGACGSEPMVTPDAGTSDAGEVAIERVMLVVQNSFFMSATDSDDRRVALVEEAFAELSADRCVSLIVFSDGWRESGYVGDVQDPQIQFLLQRLGMVENLGVFDGAMRRAKEVLEEAKASEIDPAIRWSIVILTDGYPTPTCTDDVDLSPICESLWSEWGLHGVDLDDLSVFYGYEGVGGAYNCRGDAIRLAAEMVTIARIHAILLYSEALVGQPMEASLGLNRMECAAFAMLLASGGNGNVVIEDGADIDWKALFE